MPLAQEVDITSVASPYNGTGKVLYQTGYSFWLKQTSGTWKGYLTQPSGTLQSVNFAGLVTPNDTTVYTMCYGEENTIFYNGTTDPCVFHYETSTSKFKCGGIP